MQSIKQGVLHGNVTQFELTVRPFSSQFRSVAFAWFIRYFVTKGCEMCSLLVW